MKFIKDVILNLISSLSLTFVIQVLFFPLVADNASTSVFGEYIYIYTIINFAAAVIGGIGNALYLKYYSAIVKEEKMFEYRSILGGLLTTFIISQPILWLILPSNLSIFELVVISITILFVIYRIYIRTWYRAMLKYNIILLGNVIISLTYLILLLSGLYNFNFYLTIMIAEISFTIFMLFISRNIQLIIPAFFKKRYFRPFFYLFLSFVAVTGFKYIDKWFIEYEFSSVELTYFYIAAITSTLFTVPFNNLSSVIFSYFIQHDSLSISFLTKTIIFVIIAPIVVIAIGYFVGPMIINILYIQYYDATINLFYILNIGFGMLSIDFILRGFVIKFYPEYLKMVLDLLMLIIIFFCLLLFANLYGLIGAAYAILITYTIKSLINIFLLVIYYNKIKNTSNV